MSLLEGVTSVAPRLPSRIFLYAREKWGKSSLFAHAKGVIFFMTRGETGLLELIDGGRVPPTPHFAYDERTGPPTWQSMQGAIHELIEKEHPYRLLVIDTANGAEVLCQEFVRQTQFRDSQKAFASYGKGWDACRMEWLGLRQDLDYLRTVRKMGIVLLAHTKVKKFDDPTQEEGYDKYSPACQEKLWDLTHQWADIIAFGHFQAVTYETDQGKTKARSDGVRRVICFDPSPTWDAGNRYGLSGILDVSGGAEEGFKKFEGAIRTARSAAVGNGNASPSPPPTSSPPSPPPSPPPPPTAAQATPAATIPPEDKIDQRMAIDILEACHFLGLVWIQVRDKYAAVAGFEPRPDLEIMMLTKKQAFGILEVLSELMAAKKAKMKKKPEEAAA